MQMSGTCKVPGQTPIVCAPQRNLHLTRKAANWLAIRFLGEITLVDIHPCLLIVEHALMHRRIFQLPTGCLATTLMDANGRH